MSPTALRIENIVHLLSLSFSFILFSSFVFWWWMTVDWPVLVILNPDLIFFPLLKDDYNHTNYTEKTQLTKSMQASHTTHDFTPQESNHENHKPIKHVRSDGHRDQKQHPPNHRHHHSRSLSSSFRRSFRHLTSCATAR